MLKCKISVGLISAEHTGRKKYIPYITNSNTFILSINKLATIISSDGQIKAPIFLVVYFT